MFWDCLSPTEIVLSTGGRRRCRQLASNVFAFLLLIVSVLSRTSSSPSHYASDDGGVGVSFRYLQSPVRHVRIFCRLKKSVCLRTLRSKERDVVMTKVFLSARIGRRKSWKIYYKVYFFASTRTSRSIDAYYMCAKWFITPKTLFRPFLFFLSYFSARVT